MISINDTIDILILSIFRSKIRIQISKIKQDKKIVYKFSKCHDAAMPIFRLFNLRDLFNSLLSVVKVHTK